MVQAKPLSEHRLTITASIDRETAEILDHLVATAKSDRSKVIRRAIKVLAIAEQGQSRIDPVKLRLVEPVLECLKEAWEHEVTKEDKASLDEGQATPRMLAWGSKAQHLIQAVFGLRGDDSEE